MKTIFAIVCYCIAIGFLVACVAVIVVKLIFWPPCTKIGTTCAIDPWSTAGLAGTVLAVAATVLAILGAVSVAAWWTSLNNTVTERVKKLYRKQQKEVSNQMETLLKDQRTFSEGRIKMLVDAQKEEAVIQLAKVHSTMAGMQRDMEQVKRLTAEVTDFARQALVKSEEQVSVIRQTDKEAADFRAFVQMRIEDAEKRANELAKASQEYEARQREMDHLLQAARESEPLLKLNAEERKYL